MALEKKEKFTGVIQRRVVAKGSKSEHVALVLELSNGGPDYALRIAGDSPFQNNPSLEALVGKKASITGRAFPSSSFLLIESMADVTVINPPAKSPRPPRP
jgi:hypothetical protein